LGAVVTHFAQAMAIIDRGDHHEVTALARAILAEGKRRGMDTDPA
jgi:hypothetical protein